MQNRHVLGSVKTRVMGCLMALCMVAMTAVPAVALAAPQNGWDVVGGERYWYDDGVMARDKQVYDPGSNAWYWFDADGTMARDKDVYIPVSNEDRSRGKWVRYDADGHMVKGEDFRYGGWYYFDPVTGEMLKGYTYVPSNGGKWVFYDYVTGQMAHGERYIDGSHGDEPGWMYFDDTTGAVQYGWKDLPGKRVYYDTTTGRMVYGWRTIDGTSYYFDPATGALQQQTQPEQPSEPAVETVYVTPSGKKFHRASCPSTSGHSVRAMSRDAAIAAGYEPCKNCRP